MLKKLALCFCLIVCVIALCACGKEPDKSKAAPVFSADVDYSSDRKARKEFLEEIQKLLEENIDYGEKDAVAMYPSNALDVRGNRMVYSFKIKTPKSAKMIFRCVESCESISDVSNGHTDFEPFDVSNVYIEIGENLYCGYSCFDIQLSPGQYICIRFSENDSEALYKHIQKMCASEIPPDYNTDPEAREKLLEEVVKLYDGQIDYSGEDSVELVENVSGIYVERFVIHTPKSAEMLFNCVRNAEAVHDLTGAALAPEPLPLFINEEEDIGSFDHVYIRVRPTEHSEQFLRINFTEDDAAAFYEYALKQALTN